MAESVSSNPDVTLANKSPTKTPPRNFFQRVAMVSQSFGSSSRTSSRSASRESSGPLSPNKTSSKEQAETLFNELTQNLNELAGSASSTDRPAAPLMILPAEEALLLEPTASSEKEDVTEPGVVREWWAWLISLAPCVYIQEHRGIRE